MGKVRIITATSLFDGHDVSINIMRRMLQKRGAELIHLGHNISAGVLVEAAVQEDVHAVAISSYQGGHMEYFPYVRKLLDENDCSHVKIFGGGGGVILPTEIEILEKSGVERIYSPQDGQKMGFDGIISDFIDRCDFPLPVRGGDGPFFANQASMASWISFFESFTPEESQERREYLLKRRKKVPILGISGTGGAGKSSMIDELIRRFIFFYPEIKIGIVCVDPTKKKTGGALLGDRIRMNSLNAANTYMRSMATRESLQVLSSSMADVILVFENSGLDLIVLETCGIGQNDTTIKNFSDCSLYIMTPEYGAATQLEKIEMLDEADFVALNKIEKTGGEDALRDVRHQYRRNKDFTILEHEVPVFGTTASQFNNRGLTELFFSLVQFFNKAGYLQELNKSEQNLLVPEYTGVIIPPERCTYLADIADTISSYHRKTDTEAEKLRLLQGLETSRSVLQNTSELESKIQLLRESLDPECITALEQYVLQQQNYSGDEYCYRVRDKDFKVALNTESLSGTKIPKIALPRYQDWGDRLIFMRNENLPGFFPFTAGVFPFKRTDESPKRQFAGEGGPKRTNRRFHYLCDGEEAKRLSVAFDSVTLYGEDPADRPDIFGKIGESGVSICTLADMQDLFFGFDLVNPNTSVSMTINGPAPAILAMFLNTAIRQQMEKEGISESDAGYDALVQNTLQRVRGTVQADILKEDQGQNTCIFSIDFALKMMGDVQEYFIRNRIKNFYSVSVSGYHIAEAGANPITQLAFTLANGFTLVEYYLSRGMKIDDFASSLSYFFSNGMEAEYSVIGRVARRIWAIAMRDKYQASERSQKLKYHIQTSGRSLHAQEMQFNDIRTTLQALLAFYDHCNSLHTNSYDEAVSTPTEESVRRAMAIQLILAQEFGAIKNENPMQGSFFFTELCDLVEEAVLQEFLRISRRGGVLGAMETQYQRAKIQEESMLYEHRKNSGELPIIGVNTFLAEKPEQITNLEITRATYEEKQEQVQRLRQFQLSQKQNSSAALQRLKEVALCGDNIFAELMQTTKYCSLGEITQALYEVGGQYRRVM